MAAYHWRNAFHILNTGELKKIPTGGKLEYRFSTLYYLKYAAFTNNKAIELFKETRRCEPYSGKKQSNVGICEDVKQLL